MEKDEIPVTDLPWYNTLRLFLEPYSSVDNHLKADTSFTSAEIIQSVETHHGIPQGAIGKEVFIWIQPEDFIRAMHRLGFYEKNVSGNLEWPVAHKTKSVSSPTS